MPVTFARAKGSISPDSRKGRILGLLSRYPRGQYARTMAAALDINPRVVTTLCSEMQAAGIVGNVAEPAGKGHRRVRWHTAEHAETAAKAVAESVEAATRVRRMDAEYEAKKTAQRPANHAIEAVTVPHRLLDRFAADQAPPIFSGLPLGTYHTSGSAIERAYGGAP